MTGDWSVCAQRYSVAGGELQGDKRRQKETKVPLSSLTQERGEVCCLLQGHHYTDNVCLSL